MISPPDYIQAEKNARLENAESLRANLTSSDVLKKIKSWALKHNLEPEFVLYKVKTDDTFALYFIKDPVKQTFHQKVAAKHLKDNVPCISNFEVLPAGGANAQYVVRGMVVTGSTVSGATTSHGKSIDFIWYFSYLEKTLRVVATHKHTKDDGGGQDLQFADVRRFLEEASFSHDPNTVFLAICDGPYYQRCSRITTLNEDCPGRRSAACTIEDVPMRYAYFIRTWLNHHRLEPDAGLLSDLALLESTA